MQALILIIGLIFAFIGAVIFIKPNFFKTLLAFFVKGNRIYLAGVIRLVIGALFLVAANRCAHPYIIMLLGILIIISAVLIFALKPEVTKKFINFWLSKNDFMIRFTGLFAIIFSLFVCYAAVIN
jgi:hypothetical protein